MVKYQLFESVIIAAIVVIFWTEAHGVILNDTNKTTVLSEASCICNVRQPEQFLSHGNHMICDFSASNKCYGLSDAYTENHKEWDSNKTNDYNMKTYSNIICEAIRNYYEKQWNGIPWHLMVVPFVINLILCSLAIVYQYLFTSGNCCSSGSVIHMRDDVISFKQMLREANSVCISDDSEKLISYNPQEKFVRCRTSETIDKRQREDLILLKNNTLVNKNKEISEEDDSPTDENTIINKPLIMNDIKLILVSDLRSLDFKEKDSSFSFESSSMSTSTTSIKRLSYCEKQTSRSFQVNIK